MLDKQIELSHNLALQINEEVVVEKTFYESPLFGLILFSTFGFAHVGLASYLLLIAPQPFIRVDELDPWTYSELIGVLKIINASNVELKHCCLKSIDPAPQVITHADLLWDTFTTKINYEELTFKFPGAGDALHKRTFLTLFDYDSKTGTYENSFSDTCFLLKDNIIDPSIKIFLFC